MKKKVKKPLSKFAKWLSQILENVRAEEMAYDTGYSYGIIKSWASDIRKPKKLTIEALVDKYASKCGVKYL